MAYWKDKGKDEKTGLTKYKLIVDLEPDFRGKRRRVTKTILSSSRKVEKELSLFVAECVKGDFGYDDKVLLTELCKKWIAEYASIKIKKSTLTCYNSIIDTKITPLLGAHAIGKITPLHIQEWVNYLHKVKNLSPKTINNAAGLLSKIFDTAIQWQFITKNPCSHITLPPQQKKEAKFYSKEQVEVLIDRLFSLNDNEDLQFKSCILLTLFSGMRMGEVAGLKWDAIDFDKQMVQVKLSRYYTKDFGIYEDTPKTAGSVRDIAVPNFCIDFLRKLKIQQLEKKLMFGPLWNDDQGYVILSPTGAPINPQLISRDFSRFIAREKLDPLNFHGLRHTYASVLIFMKFDIVQVSKQLGHNQLSTTQNIYSHLFKDNNLEIANKLEDTYGTFSAPQAKTNA